MTKVNEKKIRYELIPHGALRQVARVYTFGAEKHGEGMWKREIKWSKQLGSIFRHIFAFAGGEDYDKESGLHHLAHAAARILLLLARADFQPETDDRDQITDAPFQLFGVRKYDAETMENNK